MASRGEHSIDVAQGDDGIIEHNGGATDTVEDLALNFEGAEAVARQRIGSLFAHIIKAAQPVWAKGIRFDGAHDDLQSLLANAVHHIPIGRVGGACSPAPCRSIGVP